MRLLSKEALMRFPLTLVIVCFFPTLVLAQPGDCVPPQTTNDSGPRIEGIQMPPIEGTVVTSEDRDRFDREHPDLPQGDIPAPKETSTPEEREAAQRQFEAERQQHPEGRPRELFEPQHTADDQRRAIELSQQKPCPQQEQ
jgi:hypothetical protein